MLTCLCRVRDLWTSTSLKGDTEERGFTHPTPSMEIRDFTWGHRDSPDTVGNGLAAARVEELHSVFPASSWCHWRGDSTNAGAAWGCSELCWESGELTWDPDLPAWIALVCRGFPSSWVPNESQLLGRARNTPQTLTLQLSRTQREHHCSEIPP